MGAWLFHIVMSIGTNAAFAKNPKNALTFDLDVSMGKIIFRDKKSH